MASLVVLTPQDELAVLKLLAAGKSRDFVADATTVALRTVCEIAERYGYPSRDKLTFAAIQLEAKIVKDARDALPKATVGDSVKQAATAVGQAFRSAATPGYQVGGVIRPMAPPPDEFQQLVDRGKASTRVQTRHMADRLVSVRDALKKALDEEAEKERKRKRDEQAKAEATKEIAELRLQLAAAQARLGPKKKRAPRNRAPSEAATVRAWARKRGYDIPDLGKIPQYVRTAYEEAHR